MVILIDTSVAPDFLTMRQPYYNNAKGILRICATEKFKAICLGIRDCV